jgi:dihydrofolate reductase
MKKRKIKLSIQCSLDGFIEGPDGAMDWFPRDEDDQWEDLFALLPSVDTFLLGGGMYPGYSEYWRSVLTNPSAPKNEVDFARLAEKTQHIVFSKTMKTASWKNTLILKDPKEVAKLKEQPGKDMVLWGGSRMVSSFMNLGLIDEFRILVNPVILGGGKPLFSDQKERQKLELISTKAYRSGVVVLNYRSL